MFRVLLELLGISDLVIQRRGMKKIEVLRNVSAEHTEIFVILVIRKLNKLFHC